jgi:photosystem II stability/assembly factor-like uncharacterized protein
MLHQSSASALDAWRVLPIRSQQEFELGRIGGEAEQHLHGIARSPSDPNRIYWSHDVGQVWRSTDAGETWRKTVGKGLYLPCSQSIEVDPVNPETVFVIVDNAWNWMAEDFQGLYRSADGGDNWEFALPTAVNFVDNANPITHRMYTHNIAYDPSSVTSSGAKVWYAAFVENGLYKSDDYGVTWGKVADLADHDTLYGIYTHKSDGATVYVASRDGLFVYSQSNGLRPLGNLPPGAVSSVALNPDDRTVYATVVYEPWSRDGAYKKGDTVYHKEQYYRSLSDNEGKLPDESPNVWERFATAEGLYRSLDSGNTFVLLKEHDARGVFMNPGYPDTLYLVGSTKGASTWITHDGGTNWFKNANVAPAPGLGRDAWQQRIYGNTGIVPNPRNKDEAVAFSSSHIYKTTDGGASFRESSTLFTGFSWWINAGAVFDAYNPDRIMFLLCDVTAVVTDNGTNYFDRRCAGIWDWYVKGRIPWLGAYGGDFQPIAGSQVVVSSVGNYFRTKLMRSTDEGRSWNLVSDEVERIFFVRFHPEDPKVVYTSRRMSRDAGVTFSKVDFGAFNDLDPEIFGMCLDHPDTVYALDSKGRFNILRSDDRANTWYLCDRLEWKMQRLDAIPTFAVDPNDPNRVYTLDTSGDLAAATWDSRTRTMSWKSLGVLGLVKAYRNLNTFIRTVAVDPRRSQVIYAGMSASGISNAWRSGDGGTTWEDISYNLPRIAIQAMAVNPHSGELFVGSACGTWVLPPPYESATPIYDKCIPSP